MADHTITALAQGIQVAWDEIPTTPTNRTVVKNMAKVAARDVVDALRANPTWCRALGIGEDR